VVAAAVVGVLEPPAGRTDRERARVPAPGAGERRQAGGRHVRGSGSEAPDHDVPEARARRPLIPGEDDVAVDGATSVDRLERAQPFARDGRGLEEGDRDSLVHAPVPAPGGDAAVDGGLDGVRRKEADEQCRRGGGSRRRHSDYGCRGAPETRLRRLGGVETGRRSRRSCGRREDDAAHQDDRRGPPRRHAATITGREPPGRAVRCVRAPRRGSRARSSLGTRRSAARRRSSAATAARAPRPAPSAPGHGNGRS
jgi:hypothetical protein